MPSKKPTQKLRQHPIPLGRGGKWWHEQVRRNVRAIFDGLVRKGAPADRATMSRAYAFAIGSLVRYGYLKRTEKGLYVTQKGLDKSREKLRTPDAKKKHTAYERQLALVRAKNKKKPKGIGGKRPLPRRRNPEDEPKPRAPVRRLLPSLISEPEPEVVEIRTGRRSMKPVSYEEEYGGFEGPMGAALTEAGVEDSAAKAAKRRAARDLLNERREVLSRQGMNKTLMMSTFDPATGMTTWTLMLPLVRRRTGADVTISRIRAEIGKREGERTRISQLTIQQIADTDILHEQFRDPKARLDEATRLYQVIHSRGVSTAAPPRLKGWTKTAADPSTRAAYYETQAPAAVAWAMANLGPDTQPGTAMPLPGQLMQKILRVGGTAAAEKVAQRRQEGVRRREKQALRLAVRGRQMVDPEMQARPEEERKKLIDLTVARELKARGYVTGKKADKKIARAEQALGISAFRAGDEEVELPRRGRKSVPAEQEAELPRRRPSTAPSAPAYRVEDEEIELPRRKKPTQTNPSRRR